jgi:cytochrome c oxidase subunit 2
MCGRDFPDAKAEEQNAMNDALFSEASENAADVDRIFLLILGISLVILIAVALLIIGFAIRYRRGSQVRRGELPKLLSREFEIGWTSGTVFLAIFIFWWGAARPLAFNRPEADPLEIHIYAKQWMWKVEHPNGAREINTLHIPVGTPIHLVMTSQDVIHSFFVPAFRIKHDVLPGRDTQLDVHPTELGSFRLFCAEYCGTEHSNMTGDIVVMPPEAYVRWRDAQPHSDSLSSEGEALFRALGCSGCHDPNSAVHAPDLRGVFGHPAPLGDGRVVIADEAYIRDSILLPQKDVAAGYEPIMPSFSNIVDDSQITRLIAYIKSLALEEPGPNEYGHR